MDEKLEIPWRHNDFKDKKEKLKKLYGSVSESILWAVYDRFKQDYKLFGYDFKREVLELRNDKSY